MSFLAPIAAVFAASLPVVVIFYLLKRKRVVKLVSSTVLWQRFLADTQASAPFQKLRHNWLLILQLLLLALVVLALMRPFLAGNARKSSLRAIVLDGSASMQATDEKPTRFEKARAEALTWVDGLRDDEQMMILLAGATTEVKQSPTTDKAALRRALQSCQPADAPTRLADALKTAGAFTYEKRGEETVVSGEIHLFSDGAAPDLEELANKNLPLIYHKFGRGNHNVGLVRVDVRAHPENPAQRAVFASVANFSSNNFQTEIELSFDRQVVETRALTLEPTNTQLIIFTVPQSNNGVFSLRLLAEDDLAVDNRASVVSLMPSPVRVVLVTKGNRFLEKALQASTSVRLTTVAQLTDGAEGYDLCVLDDVIPAQWPKVNTLAFHVIQTNWFGQWETVTGPAVVDWRSAHPLLRFVNFDNVQIAESLAVKAAAWGLTLVESAQTPLIVAGEVNRRRLVWVGFDPLQSTWPLRISFPIFLANAVEWLDPSSANNSQLQVQVGNPLRLVLAHPVDSAQITLPDGNTKPVAVEPGTLELVVGDTTKQGIYQLKAGTNNITFCVNLTDARESSIAPRDELPLGKYGTVTATTIKRANFELWRWIAAAGLALLLFEWWWYHRRTV